MQLEDVLLERFRHRRALRLLPLAMNLSFVFADNGTGHADLTLELGDSTWRCDSYYLALDRRVLGKREDAAKVRAVLRVLLENWRAAIRGLAEGATAYLPYDFSDQGTGWLACELVQGGLRLWHGWSSAEGWAIAPSDPSILLEKPRGFQAGGGPWTTSVEEVLDGIARSLVAAASPA